MPDRPHLLREVQYELQSFEVDPMACPRCGKEMRIVAFITEPKVIDRILEHLRRTRPTRRQRAPPRRWKSAASSTSA